MRCTLTHRLILVQSGTRRCVMASPMVSEAQPSQSTSWVFVSLQMDPCVWTVPAPSPSKGISDSISISRSRIESRVQSKIHQDLHVEVCSRNGARCCSQTCERRFGRGAGSKCTLWRCRSAYWLQLQGNPLLSVATGILQSRFAPPGGHDLLSLNKLMREAKSMPDLCWLIVSVPSSFVWLRAADAAWPNRPDGSSTCGRVIMAADPNILRGESSSVSVLAWNSRKIRRVVRSSLGAECAAFSTGLEHTDTFRVLYAELFGDLCDLVGYETYLQVTETLCVNDYKSLADALFAAGSAASKTSEDKRFGIELSMIKQRLSRNETRF